MAKNKRISKKKRKELLNKQGWSYKKINTLSQPKLEKISNLIIEDRAYKVKEEKVYNSQKKDASKKITPYNRFKARVSEKRMELASLGYLKAIERGGYSDKQIDKVKLEDLRHPEKINRERYAWLFSGYGFDYDKIYTLKDGNAIYVAYRDYTQESSIEDHLATFSKHSNEQLLDELEAIVKQAPTYSKSQKRKTRGGSGGSSGKAGDMLFMVANKEVLKILHKDTYRKNRKSKRREKTRQHSGNYVGYQVLKRGRFNTHTQVTPRNLLIMANAIMYNVTEFERIAFYRNFYKEITKNIPEMREILPYPQH